MKFTSHYNCIFFVIIHIARANNPTSCLSTGLIDQKKKQVVKCKNLLKNGCFDELTYYSINSLVQND